VPVRFARRTLVDARTHPLARPKPDVRGFPAPSTLRLQDGTSFSYASACAKNRGALRNFVACSNANASLISTGSLHARPKNEIPTGKP